MYENPGTDVSKAEDDSIVKCMQLTSTPNINYNNLSTSNFQLANVFISSSLERVHLPQVLKYYHKNICFDGSVRI